MLRLGFVSFAILTSFACINGDSSKTLKFSVPADGQVTVVSTSRATVNGGSLSDSFRLDFSIFPDDFSTSESSVTVALDGALEGVYSRTFDDFDFGGTSGFTGARIANDVLAVCATGEPCEVETRTVFTSVNGASFDAEAFASLTIEEGEVDLEGVEISEE